MNSFKVLYYYHVLNTDKARVVRKDFYNTKRGLIKTKILEFNNLLWFVKINLSSDELEVIEMIGELSNDL